MIRSFTAEKVFVMGAKRAFETTVTYSVSSQGSTFDLGFDANAAKPLNIDQVLACAIDQIVPKIAEACRVPLTRARNEFMGTLVQQLSRETRSTLRATVVVRRVWCLTKKAPYEEDMTVTAVLKNGEMTIHLPDLSTLELSNPRQVLDHLIHDSFVRLAGQLGIPREWFAQMYLDGDVRLKMGNMDMGTGPEGRAAMRFESFVAGQPVPDWAMH